jgi:hypothetical protein
VPELLKIYRNRVHTSIGMTPTAASEPENEALVFTKLYGAPDDNKVPRFDVGDWVRISLTRDNPFRKGTDQTWSGEPFQVYKIKPGPAVRYYVRDLLWDRGGGEDSVVEGAFYGNELQLINPADPQERPTEFWS